MSPDETCSVCGRTILAGERTRGYLAPDGERRTVCELCRDRAERLGWVWEEVAEERPAQAEARRPGGLRGFLGGRRRTRPAVPSEPESPPEREVEAHEELDEADEAAAEPAPPAPRPDPAARGAGVGRSGADLPESPKSRLEVAATRFNASEAARTVAGLMRTLGQPFVSVGAIAGSPSEIRITVAWELSWYQWGVDLRDEGRPVFDLDKGHEIDQLDSSARQWNATAAPGGQVFLGAPVGS